MSIFDNSPDGTKTPVRRLLKDALIQVKVEHIRDHRPDLAVDHNDSDVISVPQLGRQSTYYKIPKQSGKGFFLLSYKKLENPAQYLRDPAAVQGRSGAAPAVQPPQQGATAAKPAPAVRRAQVDEKSDDRGGARGGGASRGRGRGRGRGRAGASAGAGAGRGPVASSAAQQHRMVDEEESETESDSDDDIDYIRLFSAVEFTREAGISFNYRVFAPRASERTIQTMRAAVREEFGSSDADDDDREEISPRDMRRMIWGDDADDEDDMEDDDYDEEADMMEAAEAMGLFAFDYYGTYYTRSSIVHIS
jgi:hypothetical protein